MNSRCSIPECPRFAYWRPVLKMWPEGLRRLDQVEPAEGEFGYPVCEQHRRQVTKEYLLTDEAWRTFVDILVEQGSVSPDRESSCLEFRPIMDERVLH